MSSKVEYVARSLSRGTHKKYETFIINEVYSRLNNPNLEIATQQLKDIIDLIVPHIPNETDLKTIITKIPLYAVERIKAFKNYGFKPMNTYLTGEDGYPYKDYWMITIE